MFFIGRKDYAADGNVTESFVKISDNATFRYRGNQIVDQHVGNGGNCFVIILVFFFQEERHYIAHVHARVPILNNL